MFCFFLFKATESNKLIRCWGWSSASPWLLEMGILGQDLRKVEWVIKSEWLTQQQFETGQTYWSCRLCGFNEQFSQARWGPEMVEGIFISNATFPLWHLRFFFAIAFKRINCQTLFQGCTFFPTKNIWSAKAWPEQVAGLAGHQAEVKV